jgi:hypothetical protein
MRGFFTSKGIIASIPYTIVYGVAPIEVQNAVRYVSECGAVCVKGQWQHLMPILVRDYHLLNNLLDIFVSSFYRTIHLWPIWRVIGMLDLSFSAEFYYHLIIEVLGIFNLF